MVDFEQEARPLEVDGLPERRNWRLVGDVEVPENASCRQSSPWYIADIEFAQHVDFFLDDELLAEIVSYDLVEGFVRFNSKTPDGKLRMDGDEIATEVRRGRLEVRPRR